MFKSVFIQDFVFRSNPHTNILLTVFLMIRNCSVFRSAMYVMCSNRKYKKAIEVCHQKKPLKQRFTNCLEPCDTAVSELLINTFCFLLVTYFFTEKHILMF